MIFVNTSDFIRPPRIKKKNHTLNFEALYELSVPSPSVNKRFLEKAYAAQRRGYVLLAQKDKD